MHKLKMLTDRIKSATFIVASLLLQGVLKREQWKDQLELRKVLF